MAEAGSMTVHMHVVVYALLTCPPPTRTTFKSDWELVNLDLESATSLLSEFHNTFQAQNIRPEFSTNPIIRTNHAQGNLGLSRCGNICAILQYIERKVGVASVSCLAVECDYDKSVMDKLVQILNEDSAVVMDVRLKLYHPKSYLTLLFYDLDGNPTCSDSGGDALPGPRP